MAQLNKNKNKCRCKFKTMIQELKLDPVKLYQYFKMSVGELEGTLRQLASRLPKNGTLHFFFM